MRVSVIIGTYERPHYLVRTLASMAGQDLPPHEVIVGDDGSGDSTRDVIRAFRKTVKFPVIHVRQEHDGWRKCAIMNKCLTESSGDYLVFTDGDCIHRWDWLRNHARYARPGRFLGGGDLRLNTAVSEKITAEDVLARRPFSAKWLSENGMKWRRSMVKVYLPRALAGPMDVVNFTPARFSAPNASCWKSDAEKINGFDERFGWGKEDVEFGERLRHAGLGTMHVRYVATCLHLDHPRDGTITREKIEHNFRLLEEVKREKRVKAKRGLAEMKRDYTVER